MAAVLAASMEIPTRTIPLYGDPMGMRPGPSFQPTKSWESTDEARKRKKAERKRKRDQRRKRR